MKLLINPSLYFSERFAKTSKAPSTSLTLELRTPKYVSVVSLITSLVLDGWIPSSVKISKRLLL